MRFYKEITAVHNFSFKIIRQAGRDAADQLENRQLQNLKYCRPILYLALTSVLIFIYNPIKSFLVNREFLSLLPIEIMFTDQTQLSGFLIANALMTLMGIYATCASLIMGMHFVLAISNYSIQVDLIEFDMKQLDVFWSSMKTSTLSERQLFLRNICQKCQDKDK